MELVLLESIGLPEDSIISVRAGSTRRQAPLKAIDGPFVFPNAMELCKTVKVDVLSHVGSGRGVLVGDEQQEFEVALSEKPIAKDAGQPADLPPAKLSFRVQPSGSARSERAAKKAKTKNASDDYMEQHHVLPVLHRALHMLLKEMPKDPVIFLATRLLDLVGLPTSALAAVKNFPDFSCVTSPEKGPAPRLDGIFAAVEEAKKENPPPPPPPPPAEDVVELELPSKEGGESEGKAVPLGAEGGGEDVVEAPRPTPKMAWAMDEDMKQVLSGPAADNCEALRTHALMCLEEAQELSRMAAALKSLSTTRATKHSTAATTAATTATAAPEAATTGETKTDALHPHQEPAEVTSPSPALPDETQEPLTEDADQVQEMEVTRFAQEPLRVEEVVHPPLHPVHDVDDALVDGVRDTLVEEAKTGLLLERMLEAGKEVTEEDDSIEKLRATFADAARSGSLMDSLLQARQEVDGEEAIAADLRTALSDAAADGRLLQAVEEAEQLVGRDEDLIFKARNGLLAAAANGVLEETLNELRAGRAAPKSDRDDVLVEDVLEEEEEEGLQEDKEKEDKEKEEKEEAEAERGAEAEEAAEEAEGGAKAEAEEEPKAEAAPEKKEEEEEAKAAPAQPEKAKAPTTPQRMHSPAGPSTRRPSISQEAATRQRNLARLEVEREEVQAAARERAKLMAEMAQLEALIEARQKKKSQHRGAASGAANTPAVR